MIARWVSRLFSNCARGCGQPTTKMAAVVATDSFRQGSDGAIPNMRPYRLVLSIRSLSFSGQALMTSIKRVEHLQQFQST